MGWLLIVFGVIGILTARLSQNHGAKFRLVGAFIVATGIVFSILPVPTFLEGFSRGFSEGWTDGKKTDSRAGLTQKEAYWKIVQGDNNYHNAGRDPELRRWAETEMEKLIDLLQGVPGITDPYANNPLRPCLRAAVLIHRSRRLEWERIISRIPDDSLRWAGGAAGDVARKALAECRPLY